MQAPAKSIFWIASCPRSGNTWLRVFIHSLFDEMNGLPPADNWIDDLRRYSANERALTYYRTFLKGVPDAKDWKTIAEARPKAQAEIARRATGAIFVKTHLAFIKTGGFPAERPKFSSDRFFRVGRSGQWRETLAADQVEKIVAVHGEQMRRFGYLPEA